MNESQGLPRAVVKPPRRTSWLWLLPMLMLGVSSYLGYRAYADRGVQVVVHRLEGHGLEAGDEVRYRGIAVGSVERLELLPDADGLRAVLRLRPGAERFARASARFWVVRPQFSLSGVRGLETVLGPRYVAALPGEGAPLLQFVGLEQPLLVTHVEPGDLEILLEADERGNLAVGTPITYRDVQIGTILSVGLANDAGSVEARVHIGRAYVPLVRERSRFYTKPGLGAHFGSKLLWMEFEGEFARAMVGGSIGVATPPRAGETVHTGHRFVVHREPRNEWLDWKPSIPVGGGHVPPGASVPRVLRARVSWKEGRIFSTEEVRMGWVLPTSAGLLGPADLLVPPRRATPASTLLETSGVEVPLAGEPEWRERGLAICAVDLSSPAVNVWDLSPAVLPEQPINCVAFVDRLDSPLALGAHRLHAEVPNLWRVDPEIARTLAADTWNGAVVLGRETGLFLGLLLIGDDGASIALVPPIGEEEER